MWGDSMCIHTRALGLPRKSNLKINPTRCFNCVCVDTQQQWKKYIYKDRHLQMVDLLFSVKLEHSFNLVIGNGGIPMFIWRRKNWLFSIVFITSNVIVIMKIVIDW